VGTDYSELPDDLPVPEDDGAADHLLGAALPSLRLPSTDGGEIDLADPIGERLVVYVYPRTGKPGEPSPAGWDEIPGARGCTPQSCAYRDSLDEFAALAASVIGVSAQTPAEQREFAAREHIPFPLLSDSDLRLAEAIQLPTFEVDGMILYKRLTFVGEAGKVVKAFYPVFPPDRNAGEVLAWLRDAKLTVYASAPSMPWRHLPQDIPILMPPSGVSRVEFFWLAGWLEGEGSFMAPAPSDPRRTRISAQAKDRDVVVEACRLCRVAPSL
jgi:peroxiredoxin